MQRTDKRPLSRMEAKRGSLKGTLSRAWFLLSVLLAAPLFTMNASAASDDVDAERCFALNLYHEARSEGRAGMIAVGWVVLNRVKSQTYPDSICAVIFDGGERPPCEFNWWCDGKRDRPTEPASWEAAQQLAQEMLTDPPADPTDGALWFHLDSIPVPTWLQPRERTAHQGAHYFYR